MRTGLYDPAAIVSVAIATGAAALVCIVFLIYIIDSTRVSERDNAWKRTELHDLEARESQLALWKELNQLEREFRLR